MRFLFVLALFAFLIAAPAFAANPTYTTLNDCEPGCRAFCKPTGMGWSCQPEKTASGYTFNCGCGVKTVSKLPVPAPGANPIYTTLSECKPGCRAFCKPNEEGWNCQPGKTDSGYFFNCGCGVKTAVKLVSSGGTPAYATLKECKPGCTAFCKPNGRGWSCQPEKIGDEFIINCTCK